MRFPRGGIEDRSRRLLYGARAIEARSDWSKNWIWYLPFDWSHAWQRVTTCRVGGIDDIRRTRNSSDRFSRQVSERWSLIYSFSKFDTKFLLYFPQYYRQVIFPFSEERVNAFVFGYVRFVVTSNQRYARRHLPTETCNGELIDFFFNSAILVSSKSRALSNDELRTSLTNDRTKGYFSPYRRKYLKERKDVNT